MFSVCLPPVWGRSLFLTKRQNFSFTTLMNRDPAVHRIFFTKAALSLSGRSLSLGKHFTTYRSLFHPGRGSQPIRSTACQRKTFHRCSFSGRDRRPKKDLIPACWYCLYLITNGDCFLFSFFFSMTLFILYLLFRTFIIFYWIILLVGGIQSKI